MAKVAAFILTCCLSFPTLAQWDDMYYVKGTFDNGDTVSGMIYTNNEPLEVRGNLVDNQGNTYDYWGRWNGRWHITGQTTEGVFLDLQAYDIMPD